MSYLCDNCKNTLDTSNVLKQNLTIDYIQAEQYEKQNHLKLTEAGTKLCPILGPNTKIKLKQPNREHEIDIIIL